MAAATPRDQSLEENPQITPQSSQQNGKHGRDQASTQTTQSPRIQHGRLRPPIQQSPSSGSSGKNHHNALPQSRKRPASESGHAGRSSANKKQRPHVMKDEQWVRQNLNVPTADQYPSAPRGLFADPRSTIQNMKQTGEVRLEEKMSKIGPPFFGRITCTFRGGRETINVTGEGESKVYRPV
jgi:hypothetical protein